MTHAVHHAFALVDQGQVEIGDDHALTVGERGGEQRALGRDDGSEAAAAQRALEASTSCYFRHLLGVQVTRGVDHEAARFECVMANRDFDLLAKDVAHE